jgi:hypothetical protein
MVRIQPSGWCRPIATALLFDLSNSMLCCPFARLCGDRYSVVQADATETGRDMLCHTDRCPCVLLHCRRPTTQMLTTL